MMTGNSMIDAPMMMWAMGLFWVLLLTLMILVTWADAQEIARTQFVERHFSLVAAGEDLHRFWRR